MCLIDLEWLSHSFVGEIYSRMNFQTVVPLKVIVYG